MNNGSPDKTPQNSPRPAGDELAPVGASVRPETTDMAVANLMAAALKSRRDIHQQALKELTGQPGTPGLVSAYPSGTERDHLLERSLLHRQAVIDTHQLSASTLGPHSQLDAPDQRHIDQLSNEFRDLQSRRVRAAAPPPPSLSAFQALERQAFGSKSGTESEEARQFKELNKAYKMGPRK